MRKLRGKRRNSSDACLGVCLDEGVYSVVLPEAASLITRRRGGHKRAPRQLSSPGGVHLRLWLSYFVLF